MKKMFLVFAFITGPLPIFSFLTITHLLRNWSSDSMFLPRDIFILISALGFFTIFNALALMLLLAAVWRHPKLDSSQKSLLTVLSLILGLPCGMSAYFHLTWDEKSLRSCP